MTERDLDVLGDRVFLAWPDEQAVTALLEPLTREQTLGLGDVLLDRLQAASDANPNPRPLERSMFTSLRRCCALVLSHGYEASA